jgi:DNA-binding MarR family transcriptional regulator
VGRGVVTAPPVPPEAIREHFSCRQDGQIVRRDCHIAVFAHEPAVFTGPKGALMVRLTYQGAIRRVLASKVAFALAFGQWPAGPVRPKNGDPSDLRPSNLTVTRYCDHKPQSSGGRNSSLVRRAEADRALIAAMVGPDTSLAALSRATGRSEARVSTHLGRLAARGLAESPMCCPTKAWLLTAAGRELAAQASPLMIDNLDRSILSALALAPKRQLALVAALGCCSLTIKRRASLLAQRGMVRQDAPRAPFMITAAGREALGDAVPAPWVRPEVVAASLAKDVAARSSLGGLTKSQAAVLGGRARAAQMFGRPRPDRERLTA